MDRPLTKISIGLGVFFYVLLVAGLAAHFKFPFQPVAQFFKERLEAAGPFRINFSTPVPSWPFLYRIERGEIDLITPEGTKPLIGFERISLSLQPLKILTGRLGIGFSARSGPGRISGHLEYRLRGENDLRLVIDSVDLPQLDLAFPQGRLTGHLQGKAIILGQSGIVPTGGQGSIKMGTGRLTGLSIPNLPMNELDFEKLNMEFKLDRDHLILDKFEMDGLQGGLILSGRIRDFQKFILNLSGTMRIGPPDQALTTQNFHLTGTAYRPNVIMTPAKGPIK